MNKVERNRPVFNQGKTGDNETSNKKDRVLKNMSQRNKKTPFIVTICSIFIYFLLDLGNGRSAANFGVFDDRHPLGT